MGKSAISITIFDSYDCLPEGISYPVVFNIASIAMKNRPSKDDYHGDPHGYVQFRRFYWWWLWVTSEDLHNT